MDESNGLRWRFVVTLLLGGALILASSLSRDGIDSNLVWGYPLAVLTGLLTIGFLVFLPRLWRGYGRALWQVLFPKFTFYTTRVTWSTRESEEALPATPSWRYQVIMDWDADAHTYVARVPELPGCIAHGATYEEAARDVQVAIRIWHDRVGGTDAPDATTPNTGQ